MVSESVLESKLQDSAIPFLPHDHKMVATAPNVRSSHRSFVARAGRSFPGCHFQSEENGPRDLPRRHLGLQLMPGPYAELLRLWINSREAGEGSMKFMSVQHLAKSLFC